MAHAPDALAEEMFALSREIRAAAERERDATVIVRPAIVARIAAAAGTLAQHIARADAAYAEGARQSTRAAAAAAHEADPARALLRRFVEWAHNSTRTDEDLDDLNVLIASACRLLEKEAGE